MKQIIVVVVVMAAGLLAGCSDQASILAPQAPAPIVGMMPAPTPPLLQGTWNVERILHSTETQTSYRIVGEIHWMYLANGADYRFTTVLKAGISEIAEPGGTPGKWVEIAAEEEHKGDLPPEGIVGIVDTYPTEDLRPASMLRIEYKIGELPLEPEMELIFKAWDTELRARLD